MKIGTMKIDSIRNKSVSDGTLGKSEVDGWQVQPKTRGDSPKDANSKSDVDWEFAIFKYSTSV